ERFDEAAAELQRAHVLDPLSPVIDLYTVVMPEFYARRYQQTIADLEQLSIIHHDYYPIHAHLGIAHLQLAHIDRAVADLERARRLDAAPWTLGWLGYAYARAGRDADARAVLRSLQDRAAREYVLPYS